MRARRRQLRRSEVRSDGTSLRKKSRRLEFLPHPRGEKRRHADDNVDLRAGFDEQISSSRLTILADCDSAIPKSAHGTQHARCSTLNPRRSVTLSKPGSVATRSRTASTSSRLTASIIRVFDMSRKFMRVSASS